MSIRALFSTFSLMLMAGCIVRAQSPDAEPAEVGARDAIDEPIICPAPTRSNCSKSEGDITAVCDPVCQTGDCNWCTEKCTYGKEGEIYCGLKQITERNLNDRCTVKNNGINLIDDCAPGLVCLRPSDGDTISYCFRPCLTPIFDCDSGGGVYECANRPLSLKVGVSDLADVLACNPSPILDCKTYTCCDPTKARGSANANCTTDQVCRLLNENTDGNSRTTCDLGAGGGRFSPCKSNTDCVEKFSCIDGVCKQVCVPGPGNSTCFLTGQSCKKRGEQYGYCDSK